MASRNTDVKDCKASPDGKHHYETSMEQHAVFVSNGSHTCYQCHFCRHKECKTVSYDVPDPLTLPTKEEL